MGERDEWGAFDRGLARVLGSFSQRTSRRGILATAGKLALSALGVRIAFEVLPVDRTVVEAGPRPTGQCAPWFLCGIWGRLCNCAGCLTNGRYDRCPPGSTEGGAWARSCCDKQLGQERVVNYVDCCIDPATGARCLCSVCKVCHNHPHEQSSWCGPFTEEIPPTPGPPPPDHKYCCTKVSITDPSPMNPRC